MFFLKACPKCQGDFVSEGGNLDRWGEPADIVCIQCGYTARPPQRDVLLRTLNLAMRRQQQEMIPTHAREAVRAR